MTTQLHAQQTRPGSRYTPATPSFETISPPQSQTSSFNESMSSRPLESLDKNVVSQQSNLLRTASPATSISNRSSQESTLSSSRKGGDHRKGGDLQTMLGGQDTRLSIQPSTARDRPTSAPKRMLNGEVKSTASSLITSPVDERSHSRRASRESQAAELKDRLAFAKYKLDHGYQDLKIADVEAITSQQGSPISAPSDPRNASPRKQPSLQPSTGYNSRPSARSPHCSHSPQNPSGPKSAQLPSSYDDFWNSQSQPQPRPPILAPPADVRPTSVYTPHNQARSPTNRQSLAAPTTPQRRPHLGIRSPSEQRASEADAIEALAFMSSPNNSGYYPRTGSGASGSPLRSQSQYNNLVSSQTTTLPPASQDSQQPPKKRSMTRQEEDDAIDRRLDAMSDDSDGDYR